MWDLNSGFPSILKYAVFLDGLILYALVVNRPISSLLLINAWSVDKKCAAIGTTVCARLGNVASVPTLGSIPASFDTVEIKGLADETLLNYSKYCTKKSPKSQPVWMASKSLDGVHLGHLPIRQFIKMDRLIAISTHHCFRKILPLMLV